MLKPVSTFMVPLDVALDMRLATLLKHIPEEVPQILVDGYHNRIQDAFPGMDAVKFRALYNQRDASYIPLGQPTPIIRLLQKFVMDKIAKVLNTPFHTKPEICLNTYPYHLSAEDTALLVQGLAGSLKGQVDVYAERLSLEDLNPVLVGQRFTDMALYDYDAWMDIHAKNGNWKKYTCPHVRVHAPLLISNPEWKPVPISAEKLVDEYEGMANLVAMYFCLEYLPVEMFSWSFNPDRIKPQTPLPPEPEGPGGEVTPQGSPS